MTAAAAGLSRTELAAALRRWAVTSPLDAAAVELLAAHDHWLGRDPFLSAVLLLGATGDGRRAASVDWSELAARLRRGLCDSPSELAVLALACSSAGSHPVVLGALLGRLDGRDRALAVAAVHRAASLR